MKTGTNLTNLFPFAVFQYVLGTKVRILCLFQNYSCTTRSRSSASFPLFQRLVVPTR